MIDAALLEKLIKLVYAVFAVAGTIGVALVGIAWRAGGDVREIKLAIKQHGPKIDKHDEDIHNLDKRVTRLEARQEPATATG